MNRKTMTLGALALVLGGAAVTAQPPRGDRPFDRATADSTQHRDHDRRGPGNRGPGGPERGLLRGITLTDAQRQQLDARREQQRAEMEQRRQQEIAALRSMLTAEQRKQFDANVSEMAQRDRAR